MQAVNIITQYYPLSFKALGITLQVIVISLLCAMVLDVTFGLFRVLGFKILKLIADIYIDITRGTPLLIQAMAMMYSMGSILRPYGFQWSNTGGVFTAGCVTLSLNAGAYMTEVIHGNIGAVDRGQMEVARSLGLSYGKAVRRMIPPQAFRTILSSIINQLIISLKGTSLVSVTESRELIQSGKIIVTNSASIVMSIWVCVALSYLAVCTILSRIAKYVERRVSYGKQGFSP